VTKIIRRKYRLSRRIGQSVWGHAKDPVNKSRNTLPGVHGGGVGRKKSSDHGVQLLAKQVLKGYYGNIGERQFHNIFKKAFNSKGDTSENMIKLLESRLDAFVYRSKMAPTIFAARQFVSHGLVLVNGKRVNIRSYVLKLGDEVTLKNRAKEMAIVIMAMESKDRDLPVYIKEIKKGVYSLISTPTFSEVPYQCIMQPNLVIEYYSKQ
jgi:small subunit ribosomal protein S4